jgi:Protein of unknown function DUF86
MASAYRSVHRLDCQPTAGMARDDVLDRDRQRLADIQAAAPELLDTQAAIPWRQITRMRDHLVHRYFDTAHGTLQATVDDLPELERAVGAMVEILPEEDQPVQDASSERRFDPAPDHHF